MSQVRPVPEPRARSGAAAPRVLILDDLAPEAFEVFEQHGTPAERRTGLSEDELVEAVAGAEALVVRSATRITRRVIEAAPRLRVVGRAGVGVDNIDLDAATDNGVVVMNAPTGNTTTTAELAVALLCALARNVPQADRSVRGGSWKKKHLMGTELAGKTLGVVGLGRIGRVVAQRGLGLAMNVVAFDPYLTGQRSPLEGVELVELDELLGRADFVTLHVPLNDSTHHLLSRQRIALMKPGARLINAARGGLVDEEALLAALESGRLRGAALDVLESEPPGAEHALVKREDVIVTPHLGASSDEAQRQVALDIARQVAEFLAHGVAHNAVNAPAVSAQTLREIGPYIRLAEKIGSFLAQRSPTPLRTLELALSGELARTDAGHVGLGLLVGVLSHGTETPINFVNAPRLARERGLVLHTATEGGAELHQPGARARALEALGGGRGSARGGRHGAGARAALRARRRRAARARAARQPLVHPARRPTRRGRPAGNDPGPARHQHPARRARAGRLGRRGARHRVPDAVRRAPRRGAGRGHGRDHRAAARAPRPADPPGLSPMETAQNDAGPPYGTVAFDCDSTLSAIEGIDELARLVRDGRRLAGEVAALTERAMAGELALEAVYAQRLELLKPDRGALEALGGLYVERRLPHGEALVRALRALGKRVCIVSGGLLQPVQALARALGVDESEVFAVEAFLDREGRYVGFDDESPCARAGGKLDVARELSSADRGGGVALVGDGATDLEAAPAARRFVAFGGVVRRPAVFERATVTCSAPDLAALAPLLLAPDELEQLAALGGHEALLHASTR